VSHEPDVLHAGNAMHNSPNHSLQERLVSDRWERTLGPSAMGAPVGLTAARPLFSGTKFN